MKRKDKSKIICKHIARKIFGYKDNESVYVAAVMDGLKEIESMKETEYDVISVEFNKFDGNINPTVSIIGHKGENNYLIFETTQNFDFKFTKLQKILFKFIKKDRNEESN